MEHGKMLPFLHSLYESTDGRYFSIQNLLDVFWKYSTAERKQFRRFLECMEENLL